MEQKPTTDAELMKRLQKTGARMYHPMHQLVLFRPPEEEDQTVLDIDVEAERPGNTWNWNR